jgi:hypothetical protein
MPAAIARFTMSICLLASAAMPLAAADLDATQAARFAALALAGLDREYPNKPGEVLTKAADLIPPRQMHPAFFGCFDWHSSVHGHWMLVRLLRLHPGFDGAKEARARLAAHLTAENLRTEAAYFETQENRSFERMYGWAWALRLAAELHAWDDPDARQWAANLAPLEKKIVALTTDYLPRLTYPIRTGVHPDTAFALGQILDYAHIVGDAALEKLVADRARAYYVRDRAYPVGYEPSGEDFFSPGLNVADLLRRVLPPEEFSRWLDDFLPGLRAGELGAWSEAAKVSDLSDPRIVHLVGLNLTRAWTMQGILTALAADDPRRALLEKSMRLHSDAGLRYVFSGSYEGEHWLATFAVYLLTRTGARD